MATIKFRTVTASEEGSVHYADLASAWIEDGKLKTKPEDFISVIQDHLIFPLEEKIKDEAKYLRLILECFRNGFITASLEKK